MGGTSAHLSASQPGFLPGHLPLPASCLPLPPLAEQGRIAAEVERRLSVVEELEAVVSANLQRATRFRQCILQKAFTGDLRKPGRMHNHQEHDAR
jgi:hypothetical protein